MSYAAWSIDVGVTRGRGWPTPTEASWLEPMLLDRRSAFERLRRA